MLKAVILAGGIGSRISEESHLRPKPMIEIGGRPILWHIMKIFGSFGVNDFVVCCGYRGYMIKEYFANYYMHTADVTFDIRNNLIDIHHAKAEPWRVTLIDTGDTTMTGGRLKRVGAHLDKTFCLTYGDGLSDLNISDLINAHKRQDLEATITAVQPKGRYGALQIEDERVIRFLEKPAGDNQWVNGGFFVCEPSVLGRIQGDDTVWEEEPLERLAQDGQLSVFRHRRFWMAMDTMRDKRYLEELWSSGQAPWKTWT